MSRHVRRRIAPTALRAFLHLVAIFVILVFASVCWMFLSGVIQARTYRTEARLGGNVQSLWGGPQCQLPPAVTFSPIEEPSRGNPEGGEAEEPEQETDLAQHAGASNRASSRVWTVPLASTDINVDLSLDHRKKGLLWYSTYRAIVSGAFAVSNEGDEAVHARFLFFLPAEGGVYDDFHLLVGEEEVGAMTTVRDSKGRSAIAVGFDLEPNAYETVKVRYATQGLDVWKYVLSAADGQVRKFHLTARTDFDDVDFPPSTMSPTAKQKTDAGWELTWEFSQVVGGRDMAVVMPARLNPGPLAAKIAAFAPVSLTFFLGVLFFLYLLRGIPLHPVHYAFLAASFFSFHLLFSHLVDHLSLHLSFGIASAVSVFLVVSYLLIVVDPGFAFFQAGALQLLYLVFFSFAHFYEGWTGLTVTLGGIVTLFVIMQLTARLDWEEIFPLSRKPREQSSS